MRSLLVLPRCYRTAAILFASKPATRPPLPPSQLWSADRLRAASAQQELAFSQAQSGSAVHHQVPEPKWDSLLVMQSLIPLYVLRSRTPDARFAGCTKIAYFHGFQFERVHSSRHHRSVFFKLRSSIVQMTAWVKTAIDCRSWWQYEEVSYTESAEDRGCASRVGGKQITRVFAKSCSGIRHSKGRCSPHPYAVSVMSKGQKLVNMQAQLQPWSQWCCFVAGCCQWV